MAPPRAVHIALEGVSNVPDQPVLLAQNHTHRYDFLATRLALWRRGVGIGAWVKPRTYQDRWMARFLTATGNIPVASRGWLISADVRATLGRRPTEDEYRALRSHLDQEAPLPASLRPLQNQPRDILGVPFDPTDQPWRVAMAALYRRLMALTLDHSRALMAAGWHLHIFPQGVYSSRLTPGRIGAVQAALALGVPIVPVGLSGMGSAFRHDRLWPVGGRLKLRFGEPIVLSRQGLVDFVPFDADSEQINRGALERETSLVMDRICELLEPGCRWDDDPRGDGLQGVGRFI